MYIDRDRRQQLKLELTEDLTNYPLDLGYDLDDRSAVKGWTKCGDQDILSSIIREWREEANRIHFGLRRDTETILRIDIKGDLSEEDLRKRSLFIDNIERIVGKNKGEEWMGWDPVMRWSKVMEYLRSIKIFPMEKDGTHRGLYVPVSYDGHLTLQQKSIDRAHNQVRNQNKKNVEVYIEPPPMNESQMHIFKGNLLRNIYSLEQSITLNKIQDNIMDKRLEAIKKNGNGNGNGKDKKKLLPSEAEKTFDFIDVDNMVNADGD
jgi:hypothetical protein